jgi:hypothetical protein
LIVNGAIPAQRIFIASITPSENTGQDYSPWLNDNLDSTVAFQWGNNSKYIDVTLSLSKKAKLSKISLYDGPGSFTDQPDSIYALNGLQKTLLGVFTGNAYNGWVDINVDTSVTATAIVINKYGNNLPVKIKIFGYEVNDPAITASEINFDELPAKTVGDAPFSLNASSTNIETPVTFQSSDPAVASVSNSTGNWMVTLLKEGSVSITAAQSGNANFTPAVSVSRTLIVNKLITDSSNRIPVVSIVASENTGQDYSPWLNDNLDSTVAFQWGVNDKYVDITLLTDSLVKLSKISLYDGLGSFANLPDSIYILNGSQKTLIGAFDGSTYNS